ncbi:hypothetical protein HanRHA438_Chr05g0239091 [Helianthus annuus]|nr:hypothetical protein HanHA89_Chr05g0203111 [Helianthus annuus]KAJ0920234.1 hypothetical protein HanRHA438_Chr05g0239091 [Helianthus annuus]
MILHLIPQLFDDRSSFGYYKNPNFQISKRWHVGHSHHDQTSEESDKIFWLGLSTGKVLTGYLSGSTADAAHALSDVVVIKMFDTSLEEPPQKRLEVEDNRRRKVFRKRSAVCGPHLQASAGEEVDQMSAVCKENMVCFFLYKTSSRFKTHTQHTVSLSTLSLYSLSTICTTAIITTATTSPPSPPLHHRHHHHHHHRHHLRLHTSTSPATTTSPPPPLHHRHYHHHFTNATTVTTTPQPPPSPLHHRSMMMMMQIDDDDDDDVTDR